jgi:2-desacetyl-2-hydroxyethyl bacteriochlorophyllide A dehydrogenase
MTNSPSTNRRVVVSAVDDVRIELTTVPSAAPGEVVVKSAVVGICGSDMHAAHGRHPFVHLPMRPGHEVMGTVVETGPGVDTALRGARVVVEPNLACGTCPQCLAGRYNICATLDVFGCQTPGGMCDRFAIAADRVVPVPDDLSDVFAALVEPAATPVHAVRRAGDLRGQRVMVIGAGPIGLFALLAARAAGAGRIVVADLVPSKRARAERLGADATLDPAVDGAADRAVVALGGKADVVFDCVSRESSVALAIQVLDKGRTLMIVGVPNGRTPIDLELVQDRELAIFGNLMYVREDVEAAIELLRHADFDIDEMVTGQFDIEDAASAFAAADDPEQVKILVNVRSVHRPETASAQ